MTGSTPGSPPPAALVGGLPAFEVDGRPAPAPRAHPRDALREVYVELLAIERERLQVAVRIERERGFVFPETSVIVRDVRFLAEKVYGPTPSTGRNEEEDTAEGVAPPSSSGELDGILTEPAKDSGELGALFRELGEP